MVYSYESVVHKLQCFDGKIIIIIIITKHLYSALQRTQRLKHKTGHKDKDNN